MENTIVDFWKMIYENDIDTIIMLNSLYEEDQASFTFYRVLRARYFIVGQYERGKSEKGFFKKNFNRILIRKYSNFKGFYHTR